MPPALQKPFSFLKHSANRRHESRRANRQRVPEINSTLLLKAMALLSASKSVITISNMPDVARHPFENTTSHGWILYDGRCGMCSVGVRRLRALFHQAGFVAIPLQTPWVVAKLGAGQTLSPREMGLLTPDGRLLQGVDVYIHLAEQSGWSRPLATAGKIRWVHRVLSYLYRWIAAHRQRISTVCRLQPDLPEETGRDK